MSKVFSFAAFVAYGNSDAKGAAELQKGFIEDAKKFFIKGGCPSKDEIDILNDIKPDMTHTISAIPGFVSSFIADEDRALNIPAPNKNCSPASISIKHREEKTRTGVNQMGDSKGEQWTSTTAAHDEFYVKNNTSEFKK